MSSEGPDPNPNPSPNPKIGAPSPKAEKGKSCKGSLYYSSTFKSKARNPLCVGFTKSLSHVPHYIGESENKASQEGRNLTDFKYGCVGYSLYKDCKNQPNGGPDSQTELPICVGLEVLVDRRHQNAEPAVIHNKDGQGASQHRPQKPAPSFGDEFLGRFNRNANLVAMGVLKNLRRVGNQIKDAVDDMLYPYRRRPK